MNLVTSRLNIYIASSWKNEQAIKTLCQAITAVIPNSDVYDFTNHGFSWNQIGLPLDCTIEEYIEKISNPIAQKGALRDYDALKMADVCILVLPAGNSSHIELGYSIACEKFTIIYCENDEDFRPDLMYAACNKLVRNIPELLITLNEYINSFTTIGCINI